MTQFNALNLGQAYNIGRRQNGAYIAPIASWSAIPAALSTTAIANVQTVSGQAMTLTAGPGVTSTTLADGTYLDLGVRRCLTSSGNSATTPSPITVVGRYDVIDSAGRSVPSDPATFTFTGASGAAFTTSIVALRYVKSVTAASNTTSNLAIGTADVFGLPWAAKNFSDVPGTSWNSALVASTGFTGAVASTPTATTGDVRGLITPTSAADGTRELVVYVRMRDLSSSTLTYGLTPYNG